MAPAVLTAGSPPGASREDFGAAVVGAALRHTLT